MTRIQSNRIWVAEGLSCDKVALSETRRCSQIKQDSLLGTYPIWKSSGSDEYFEFLHVEYLEMLKMYSVTSSGKCCVPRLEVMRKA